LISWPERYAPGKTAVHVRNEMDMSGVSPEVVWAWLVRAKLWPTWYVNSRDVQIFGDGDGQDLRAGSRFRWKTFGASLQSVVEEFVPNERLAWSARGTGIDVYHAWLIEKRPAGCYVLTEENQNGFLARVSSALRPGNMRRQHQVWLEALSEKAKGGLPPPA
jgi:uncharacterized protein YndB with AHSA1/START domain